MQTIPFILLLLRHNLYQKNKQCVKALEAIHEIAFNINTFKS